MHAVQTLDANSSLCQVLSDNAVLFAAGYQWKDIAQRQQFVYLAATGLI